MREHYSADKLDQPVQIIRTVDTPDGMGGYTAVESTLPGPTSHHLCHVRPLRGAERSLNDGLAAVGEMLFVTWAAIDVRSTDVLLHKGVRYNVRHIAPPGLSQFQEITAESGVVS